DTELGSIWSAPSAQSPNRMVVDASTAGMFPLATGDMATSHPGYALMRPAVAPVGMGMSALVLGWDGPTCIPPHLHTPSFAVTASVRCSVGTRTRSFTVNGTSGVTAPTQVRRPHAFGASTVLADGTVVVSGGIADGPWTAQNEMDVYTGTVSPTGDAMTS